MFKEEEKPDQEKCVSYEHEMEMKAKPVEMERLTEAGKRRQGALHSQLIEYYHVNRLHSDIIKRLDALIIRMNGQRPEDPNKMAATPEPDGVLDGMRMMNSTHQDNLEQMMHLISILEEAI